MKIKGWKKFQHFRDRRPPWIKLYRDILDDPDWHDLDGDSAKALVMIWLIASEEQGELPDARKIAFRLRVTEARANQLLNKLSHWLEQDDIETISDGCRDDAPERETERETDSDANASVGGREATRPVRSEDFEQFWKVYPKREGSNPKEPARKKFTAIVKSGTDPPAIIRAAEAYAAEQRQLGKIGTSYVAQAVTWLNQQRWCDYQDSARSPDRQAEIELMMKAKGYHWDGGRWVNGAERDDGPADTNCGLAGTFRGDPLPQVQLRRIPGNG